MSLFQGNNFICISDCFSFFSFINFSPVLKQLFFTFDGHSIKNVGVKG